jgi:uroporphyrinogen-III decarboxylase
VQECGEIAAAHGRLLVLHMCGLLKAILPDLSTLPAAAFEAFTSSPVGNTSFADGRSACPDKCLVGGTNATLWTRPADEIIAEIRRDLDALPHHRGLVVTSAGVMPPLATPETIRQVCDFVKSYDARM